jgi:hypothetical protein
MGNPDAPVTDNVRHTHQLHIILQRDCIGNPLPNDTVSIHSHTYFAIRHFYFLSGFPKTSFFFQKSPELQPSHPGCLVDYRLQFLRFFLACFHASV